MYFNRRPNVPPPPVLRPPYPPAGPPYEGSLNHAEDFNFKPIPPHYPYLDPCVHDSYSGHCYHETNQFPFPGSLPASGPYHGAGFMIRNFYPYLYDTTHVRYGNYIHTAETCVTRVSQRPNTTAVDLAGTFNFTKQIQKNSIIAKYLEQCINQKADELKSILPIIKAPLTFRLYFTILDDLGGVVFQNVIKTSTSDLVFHFTDIRDFYIQSTKSMFMTTFPAMDYQGIYRLNLEKVEIYVDAINTIDHITNNINPYYAFENNNDAISLNHETIGNTDADEHLMLASLQLNQTIPFQANITTNFKLSFTAFMSELISIPQTYPIYDALFNPTGATLQTLKQEISNIKDSIVMMNETINQMANAINEVRSACAMNTNNIATLNKNLTEFQAAISSDEEEIDARLNDLDARVKKLEAIPFATLPYANGTEFVRNQLTWVIRGQLYQCTKNFTACGDFNTEIASGRIVPLTITGDVIDTANQAVVDELVTRIEACEEKADTAATKADSFADEIEENNQIVETIKTEHTDIKSDITTIKENADALTARVDIAEGKIATNTSNIGTNTNSIQTIQNNIGTMADTLSEVSEVASTAKSKATANETKLNLMEATVNQNTVDILTKASQADLETLSDKVDTKASTTAVTAIDTRLGILEASFDNLNGSVVTKLTQEEYIALTNKQGIYYIIA